MGKSQIDSEADRKAAICRSNACGHYDPQADACGVLVALGKAGAVRWLYSHPKAGCADKDNPQF